MADVIQTTFTADITDLEKGVAAARGKVSGFKDTVESVSPVTAKLAKTSKRDIGEVGRAVADVGRFIGGEFGNMAVSAGLLVNSIKGLIASVVGIIGPVGLAAAAFVGAGVALVNYAFGAKEAKKATDELADETDKVSKRVADVFGPLLDSTINIGHAMDLLKGQVAGLPAEFAKIAAEFKGIDAAKNILSNVDSEINKLKEDIVALISERGIAEAALGMFEYAKGIKATTVTLNGLSLNQKDVEDKIRTYTDAISRASIELASLVKKQEELRRILEESKGPLLDSADIFKHVADQTNQRIRDIVPEDLNTLMKDRLALATESFRVWAADMGNIGLQALEAIKGFAVGVAQSIGDTLAAVIVDGENFAEALQGLLKQIAKSIISTLIQIAVQWLIYQALHALGLIKDNIKTLASYAAQAYAIAYVGILPYAIETSLFGAPAIAGIFAAGAVATMLGGAAAAGASGAGVGAGVAGAGGLATGGIVVGPTLALVGEAGPEAVIPLSKLDRMFNAGGMRPIDLIIQMDGRTLTRKVVDHLPAVVRFMGVKGI